MSSARKGVLETAVAETPARAGTPATRATLDEVAVTKALPARAALVVKVLSFLAAWASPDPSL